VLHRVVDRQAGVHLTTGGVDVQGDVLVRVLRLEVQELPDDEIRDLLVDGPPEEDDPVSEQPRVEVERALGPAVCLEHGRDQRHDRLLFAYRATIGLLHRNATRRLRVQIERKIVLPVPREEAWEALTEPERLEEWFANDVELDAVPGGEAVFEWDNGEVRHAVVETVEELERLVLRWDDEGTVELELVEHPAGTLVHVRETAPEWGVALDLHASAAWASA
jgi:uncharacterized protein YndB with AHSA1/START domain